MKVLLSEPVHGPGQPMIAVTGDMWWENRRMNWKTNHSGKTNHVSAETNVSCLSVVFMGKYQCPFSGMESAALLRPLSVLPSDPDTQWAVMQSHSNKLGLVGLYNVEWRRDGNNKEQTLIIKHDWVLSDWPAPCCSFTSRRLNKPWLLNMIMFLVSLMKECLCTMREYWSQQCVFCHCKCGSGLPYGNPSIPALLSPSPPCSEANCPTIWEKTGLSAEWFCWKHKHIYNHTYVLYT